MSKRKVRIAEADDNECGNLFTNNYIKDLERLTGELVEAKKRVDEAEKQLKEADYSNKRKCEKRVTVLIKEFHKAREKIDLYRNVCSSTIEETSREVDADSSKRGKVSTDEDLKMETEGVTSSCGRREEKKQVDVMGVSPDVIDQDVEMGGIEKSQE